MALIQCPECKKEVSDRCGRCPPCGFPVEKHFQQIERENAAAKKSVAAKENAAAKARAASEKEEKETVPFAKGFWRRAWIIAVATLVAFILSAVLSAGGAILSIGYAKFFVPPTYTATAKVHITAKTSNDSNITGSDLTASQSLVESYKVILETPETLYPVIEETGNKYTYNELLNMISFGSVNNTEIFYIQVDATDPIDALWIASTICEVLPDRIAETFVGISVSVVQEAGAPNIRSAPVLSEYAIIGAIPGVAVGVLMIAASFVIVTVIASRQSKKKNT